MTSVLSPRVITASVAALGATAALSGCGVLVNALGGGNVLSVEVGECFVVEEMAQSEVTDVPVVDCSEPHDGEFFYVEEMAEGEFPGAEAASQRAEEACTGEAFSDYVGMDYATSEIYASYLIPTQESWDRADDREILCYLESMEMVTDSMQGAGI